MELILPIHSQTGEHNEERAAPCAFRSPETKMVEAAGVEYKQVICAVVHGGEFNRMVIGDGEGWNFRVISPARHNHAPKRKSFFSLFPVAEGGEGVLNFFISRFAGMDGSAKYFTQKRF